MLKLYIELLNEDSLPFLDVLVKKEENRYMTSVYTKSTNLGLCMNGKSECPDRYKKSVISAYVRRAVTHCSSWTSVHQELQRVSQVLVNNGHSSDEIQRCINKQMRNFNETPLPSGNSRPPIKLYYRNFMSTAYKADERILKSIVERGVTPTDENDSIKLVIFYKNKKTSNLVMKNNITEVSNDLSRTGVVYEYNCPMGNCKSRNNSYIGMTTTTLSRRLTLHLQNGTPKTHTLQEHNVCLTRDMLVSNTTIIDGSSDKKRLQVMEALYILNQKPSMNVQIGSTSIPLPSSQRIS